MQIEVAVEDLSSVRKKLEIEIPGDLVRSEFESIGQAWRKEARIPGFRKGRAPLGLVQRTYRKEIRGEVVQNLVSRSYQEALQQQGWRPVGEPEIGEVELGETGPLHYVATLEVLPELKLPPYEGLQVKDVDEAVSAQEVASALQELRQQHARFEAVEDRPIQEGDAAVIDLRGEFLPGDEDSQEPIPDPIHEEDVRVEVGGERTHEAFSKALVGMNLAQEKAFEVSYPQDYPEKKLAARRVRYTVEVTDVQTRVLPELDDAFAREVGDFETLELMQERLEEDLQRQKAKDRESQIRNQLLAKLIEQTGFELPETLVEARIDSRVREVAYNMVSRGIDPARAGLDWPKLRQEMRPRVEQEIRSELILDQIASEQAIRVEPEDEREELARAARSMNAPPEQVRSYFSQEGRFEQLRQGICRRKALDWLREKAQVG